MVLIIIASVSLWAGCAQQQPLDFPSADMFEVQLRLERDVASINQPLNVHTWLLNNSEDDYIIHHGAPLIAVEIACKDWSDMLPRVALTLDITEELSSGERYDPDTHNFVRGDREIAIDTPGYYTITGYAEFYMIDPVSHSMKEYKIRSRPVFVEIIE